MKKFLLPIIVLLVVGGAIALGVILSKQSEVPVTLRENAISETDHRQGNPEATVELVEYADFQCPACASADPLITRLMSEHGTWINFAYRHLPLKSIHPNAVPAAEASEAAHKQGKFWEMKELLYARQNEWKNLPDATGKFVEYAEILQLDVNRFRADMDSQEVRSRVESDYQTTVQLGLNSTPTLFVNGEKVSNPGTYEQLVQLLESKRAQ